MNKFFGHLKTVLTHKFWVFYYSCIMGIPWRGFIHDLSKFSPVEFWEGVKYYQGISSPINKAKEINGYSKAWQHHKGRNKHHYEYWTDNYDNGTTCIKMPYKYAIEMLCDYLGAARAYLGKNFSYSTEFKWWINKKKTAKMHPSTADFITKSLDFLRAYDNYTDGPFVIRTYIRYLYDKS